MALIMGVVNLTPDSFREETRYNMEVLRSGADIIDLGAVSSRPGASPVSEEEEWRRISEVLPMLPEGVRYSLDTCRSGIVRRFYDKIGDFIVNDISAGEDDPRMLPVVASLGLQYVAMHKRGNPLTMDSLCDYPGGVVEAVEEYFEQFSRKAGDAGVSEWILDPGFGFAKTDAQNLELLDKLDRFKRFGRPVLVGIADKRFTRGRTEEMHREALLHGADILRVHDVPAAIQTLKALG